MTITEDIPLPTYEELTVPEVNVSAPVLRATGMHLGKYCDEQSKEYMLCKAEVKDPRYCLNYGKEVTACAMQFFRKVKAVCREETEFFARCLEWNDPHMRYYPCRREQVVYDRCMEEKFGLKRPPFGYFTQLRVHDSARPAPKADYPTWTPLPGLPKDRPIEPNPYGMRFAAQD